MLNDIIFLQQAGEFVSTSREFKLDAFDNDEVEDVLQDIEYTILESPRKSLIHEDNNERIIAYPITALVKRGLKSIVNYDYFSTREMYNDFLDALNSRRNDYIVINKH